MPQADTPLGLVPAPSTAQEVRRFAETRPPRGTLCRRRTRLWATSLPLSIARDVRRFAEFQPPRGTLCRRRTRLWATSLPLSTARDVRRFAEIRPPRGTLCRSRTRLWATSVQLSTARDRQQIAGTCSPRTDQHRKRDGPYRRGDALRIGQAADARLVDPRIRPDKSHDTGFHSAPRLRLRFN